MVCGSYLRRETDRKVAVLLSLPLFTLSVRSLYLPSAALQVKRQSLFGEMDIYMGNA